MRGPDDAALPPHDKVAWLLDLDGTLIDIAAAPDQVVVPRDLPMLLRQLRARCGDAVAIVTGRPIAQVDELLGDAPYAVAGEHGTAIRHSPGGETRYGTLPPVPANWVDAARDMVAAHDGSILEPKAHGFVLHYRAVPQAGPGFRRSLETMMGDTTAFRLVAAKMAWEIRPAGIDKGVAVEALMREPPFAGRVPVYIGDDVTDRDGMRAAVALGGMGLFVAEVFGEPEDVRHWLALRTA